MAEKKKRKKGCLIVSGILVALLLYGGFRINWNLGALRDIFSLVQKTQQEIPQATYSANREANLKAIYTALMLAHDSDGQFPAGDKWMDAIKTRLRTSDLPEAEALKKLRNPTMADPTHWGYALNKAVANQFKDDIKDPAKTPLVYESKQNEWNAFGDPNTDRPPTSWAISVTGVILKP